jgi:hypothetical protein
VERLRDYEALQRRRDAERAAEAAARLAMQVWPVSIIQVVNQLPILRSMVARTEMPVKFTVKAGTH